MKIIATILIVLAILLFVGWLGLKIHPRSFPEYSDQNVELEMVPLPTGLPKPVERFYRQVYGDQVPVIESAVISGRASMRVNGITFPARFRFTHIAGKGYRHYIEATFFGMPIMKVNEHYLDGSGRLELPFGVFESEQVDQAANLGMWAEAMRFPAILVTNPLVRWEPVDQQTAVLVVPFKDEEQRFIVRFDPEDGLLQVMETMRYRDAEGGNQILWLSQAQEWEQLDGTLFPITGAAIWLDEGTPWALFSVEEVIYNADVSDYIRVTGP
jgi:hypothetical protein